MSGFGRAGGQYSGPTEQKGGVVTNVKASPERGRKRLVIREKTGSRTSFAVDIPYKESRGVERKKDYSFDVYEKEEVDRGGMLSRSNSAKFRTYMCDEAPSIYKKGGESQFKNFSSKR